jgi:hypothetical protein
VPRTVILSGAKDLASNESAGPFPQDPSVVRNSLRMTGPTFLAKRPIHIIGIARIATDHHPAPRPNPAIITPTAAII